MRLIFIPGVVLLALIAGDTFAVAHEEDVEKLIAESDPAIQEQFNRTHSAFFERPGAGNCGAYSELQALRDRAQKKDEIVKQLAIFVVTTTSEEDVHVIAAFGILQALDLPAGIPIRVLAPYLDAENKKLRDLARMWFHYHDSNSRTHGQPPLGSVNYYDYMMYVRSQTFNYEEIPDGFVEYIYEQQPDRALLVFYYGTKQVGRPREILWGEHVVSNALWLKDNDFDERFQQALPEAAKELAKLSKYDEWWARLYVAEIMRRYPALRQPAIVQQLAADSNALVSKAARSAEN